MRRCCPSCLPLSLILGLFFALGCATAPDPELPDLSAAMQEGQTRMLSVSAAERTIQSDLDEISALRQNLSITIDRAEENGQALSLLRLVAMNCLNTEYGDGISEVVALEGVPLSCRPAHFDHLQTALEDSSPTVRDQTLELLYVVDQIRVLRGSLRRRIARLPASIADHRDFIVEERATLRRLEADLARRRSLYSALAWGEVIDRISEHRVLLRDFELYLEEVEQTLPEWPAFLDEVTGEIYFSLADLRARE